MHGIYQSFGFVFIEALVVTHDVRCGLASGVQVFWGISILGYIRASRIV
jgi:hypothetical protein